MFALLLLLLSSLDDMAMKRCNVIDSLMSVSCAFQLYIVKFYTIQKTNFTSRDTTKWLNLKTV